jgi:uncharacterized protein (DUF4415 family)
MRQVNRDGSHLALYQSRLGQKRCWLLFICTGRVEMARKSSGSSQRGALKSMSADDIRNRRWTDAERTALSRAARAQHSNRDSNINFSDIPRLSEDQLSHLVRLRQPSRKVAVSVRLDPDVLEWLRGKGEGHLTRINDILANLMEQEGRLRSKG